MWITCGIVWRYRGERGILRGDKLESGGTAVPTIDWNSYWARISATALAIMPRLLAVVLVLFLLRFAVRLATGATARVLGKVELAPEAESLLETMVRITVVAAGLVVVLLIMGWGQLA